MLGTRRVVALIAARGGSKGLPGKNVAPCGGRPLIAWSVMAGCEAGTIDRVLVSTDDTRIGEAALAAGAHAVLERPPELATDEAAMAAVVAHALDHAGGEFDIGVLLQATSPLRTAEDIDETVRLLAQPDVTTAVTVTQAPKSPYWMYAIERERLVPILRPDERATRRQDLPRAYVLNGAVYAFSVAHFRRTSRFVDDETRAHVMPFERSVDIDTKLDLALADLILRSEAT